MLYPQHSEINIFQHLPLSNDTNAATTPQDVPLIIFIQLMHNTHQGGGGCKQEGGRHGQRTKDHGEKIGSGLLEVNMTSKGGVPRGSDLAYTIFLYQTYDMQISLRIRTCPQWKMTVCGQFPPKKDPQIHTCASPILGNLGHPKELLSQGSTR